MLLGEILIQNNQVTDEELQTALNYQKSNGGLLGIILIQLNYITEQELIKALLQQHKINGGDDYDTK